MKPCHHQFTVEIAGTVYTIHCLYEEGHDGDCLTGDYGYRRRHDSPFWASEDSDWPGWVGPRGETWPPPSEIVLGGK